MDIDILGRLAMEGRVRDWIGCGYTCPKKDGNDQILKKRGITCLGMALTLIMHGCDSMKDTLF